MKAASTQQHIVASRNNLPFFILSEATFGPVEALVEPLSEKGRRVFDSIISECLDFEVFFV